ncbi:MAG: alkaline phosphatase family protein [Limisphaerales bacterium]
MNLKSLTFFRLAQNFFFLFGIFFVFKAKLVALPDPTNCPIQHVVVVMMENRSFDHLLGWMTNANGRQAGLTYTNNSGQAFSTYPLAPDYQGCSYFDPDHSYAGGRVEFNNGAGDGWLRANSNDLFSIGYYTRADLPFLSAAATNWTICSNYFSAIMAETYPNRIYQHAAQTDRLTNSLALSTLPTIWDRLSDAGLSRRYYFSDIPLIALWGIKYLPISRTISSFYDDCVAGTLPNVSFVEPRFFNESLGTSRDDHPHADIRNGEVFLNQVYQAVTLSPNWSNTVMVINFDEWGGFFDHVAPPTAPITPADQAVGNLDGRLGFRVPCLVISPWAKRGFVASGQYDHTSILNMIEWRWNLAPLTIRDQTAQNLAQVLDFSQTNYIAPQFIVPSGPFGVACPLTTWITRSGTNTTVHWLSDASLQTAPTVTGPWSVVTNANAPYTFLPTNQMQFFRVVDKWTSLVDKARQFGFPGF